MVGVAVPTVPQRSTDDGRSYCWRLVVDGGRYHFAGDRCMIDPPRDFLKCLHNNNFFPICYSSPENRHA